MIYCNDNDSFSCAWMRNLMAAGLIPEGRIDERPIEQVQPDDLDGFTRCHFFAGIAGWEEALRLAGWDTTRPVWTGSCPCQPYSQAGKQKGEEDERDLWPEMFRLIRECRPATVFGEQVDGAIGHGWLDRVQDDLEGEGYACGATVLPAASIGAPHARHRLFWVADARHAAQRGQDVEESRTAEGSGAPTELGRRGPTGDAGAVADSHGRGCGERGQLHGGTLGGIKGEQPQRDDTDRCRADASWSDFAVIPCHDGKHRRVPRSGVQPLAHGVPSKRADPRLGYLLARLGELGHDSASACRILREARANRVGRLRGFGNAIVPEVATVFIRAFMESEVSRCSD